MNKLLSKSNTRQELLNNTVTFYNLNNRGYDEETSSCRYITPDGKKRCAIGRELPASKANKLKDVEESVDAKKVLCLLPKRLIRMGEDFLMSIQSLHDGKRHWDEKGLSSSGRVKVRDICNEYNLKTPKL